MNKIPFALECCIQTITNMKSTNNDVPLTHPIGGGGLLGAANVKTGMYRMGGIQKYPSECAEIDLTTVCFVTKLPY